MFLIYFAFIGGKNGYLSRRAKVHLIERLYQNIQQLNAQNQQLKQEIKSLLGDLNSVEKIARERLGFARRGELVYKFVP